MYWILKHQRNCDFNNDVFVTICSSIHEENLFIWSSLPAHIFLLDLFMEQLVLCGLVGFQEFINHRYYQFINDFVRTLECQNNSICNEHTLGVAVAVECLSIKYTEIYI